MDNKILSILGLIQRSGNLITGEDTCEAYIKKNIIRFILVAEDASDNTKKKFKDMSRYRNIKFTVFGDKASLSQAIGKTNRAVYGIKDENFANQLFSLIQNVHKGSNKLGGE